MCINVWRLTVKENKNKWKNEEFLGKAWIKYYINTVVPLKWTVMRNQAVYLLVRKAECRSVPPFLEMYNFISVTFAHIKLALWVLIMTSLKWIGIDLSKLCASWMLLWTHHVSWKGFWKWELLDWFGLNLFYPCFTILILLSHISQQPWSRLVNRCRGSSILSGETDLIFSLLKIAYK